MLQEISHIVTVMMTSLKDVRSVDSINFIGKEAVRFKLKNKLFDVRGHFPLFAVHEIEGSCMVGSKAAYEIERQLNSEPLSDEPPEFTANGSEEALNDLLCSHVDSMEEQHVRAYNEECGGPDLDPIESQRIWLKTHFLHMGANVPDMLEAVRYTECRDRSDTLAKAIKDIVWSAR